MKGKIINKLAWLISLLSGIILFLGVCINEPIFFINRTASMPRGLYLVDRKKYNQIGDIIVFKSNEFNGNLIKYIAAVSGDRYCFDEAGALWVNEIPIAQKNIEKYSQPFLAQSICHILNEGELLVIGDHENSYDSRYFGPIKKNDVIATAKLLWQIK